MTDSQYDGKSGQDFGFRFPPLPRKPCAEQLRLGKELSQLIQEWRDSHPEEYERGKAAHRAWLEAIEITNDSAAAPEGDK